jgi:UPF0176 protein
MAKEELRNKLNREQAMKLLQQESFRRITLSFYRYVDIAKPQELRDSLFALWSGLGVLGRVYLAHEGINAQINVPEPKLEEFKQYLDGYEEFRDMPFKIGLEQGFSFYKLTIKVRRQIVADGLPAGSYNVSDVGKHLTAPEVNAALEQPDTVVVDMRNHYESEVGHFQGALKPDVDTFKDALPEAAKLLQGKEDKKIILYCTGGIRCEKASSYLKAQGFQDVNQIYGGIIYYAEQAKKLGLESKFKGKNFVFDERLGERVTDDIVSVCHQCGQTSDQHTNCANEMCNLLFIQCSDCAAKWEGACSQKCQGYLHLSEDEKKSLRQAQTPTNKTIFRKRVRPRLAMNEVR